MRAYRKGSFLALGLLCLASGSALAAPTTINGVTYDPANASGRKAQGPDTSLRLKKIFLFPSVDDLSGVLAPKLDEKLVQLFGRNSRFDLVRDAQVMRALSPDDKSYGKAASSPVVHKEAARVTGSDTTVVLKTRSVGNETEMVLEFRDAEGDILFAETGSIPGFSAMDARWGLIERLYEAVLSKIPFDGTVTGRTGNTITLDLGAATIKRGEEVDLARVVSVQRHPLLRTVVGTDYVRVGKARVSTVDRSLSFADVVEEFPGELISPGAKVLRTKSNSVRRPEPAYTLEPSGANQESAAANERFEERLKGEFDRAQQRYGQVGVNLQYGSLTHAETAGTAQEYSGSGIGGNIEGELWVTKHWIATVNYGFHNSSLSGGGVTVGDSSWRKFELYGGYRIFPDDLAGGVKLTGSLGYQVQDYAIPTPAGTLVSGKRYSGIAVRLDGEMLLTTNSKINGGFGFQPFSSMTDNGAAPGVPDGATVLSFHLGWNYRFGESLWARLGMQFDNSSGNYLNNASVSDKRFAIGPGVFYSF
jgi:hypothetical protein